MIKKRELLLLVVLLLGGCATKQNSIHTNDQNSSHGDMQSKMVEYVNYIRQKGATCAPPAPPLHYNQSLEQAAKSHAKDMALNRKLSHKGSGTDTDLAKRAAGVGSTHIERILYFGYPNKVGNLLGETITYTKLKRSGSNDYFSHFKRAIKNLMDDRVHCETVMNPRFTDVGMGMYKGNDRYYFVMDLGERK